MLDPQSDSDLEPHLFTDSEDSDDAMLTSKTMRLRQVNPYTSNGLVDGGLRTTMRRFYEMPTRHALEEKLDRGEYLDTQEQQALISHMNNIAETMTSMWRYVLLFCGISFFLLVFLFFFVTTIYGFTTTSFLQSLQGHIDIGILIVLELVVMASICLNIWYTYDLPLPHDDLFIISTAATVISSAVYIIVLFFHDCLTILSLWMPGVNIILYLLILYSQRDTMSLHESTALLSKYKYKYETA